MGDEYIASMWDKKRFTFELMFLSKPFKLPYKISQILIGDKYKANINPISPGNMGLSRQPSAFTLPLDTDTETFSNTLIYKHVCIKHSESKSQNMRTIIILEHKSQVWRDMCRKLQDSIQEKTKMVAPRNTKTACSPISAAQEGCHHKLGNITALQNVFIHRLDMVKIADFLVLNIKMNESSV